MKQEIVCGNSLELLPDLCPHPAVILTDPPYGTGKNGGYLKGNIRAGSYRSGEKTKIANDHDTSTRDDLLRMYPNTPAIVFGTALRPPPPNAKQALCYQKPPDSGALAARNGWRRDAEVIYLCGPWPVGAPVRSSVLRTTAPMQGGKYGLSSRAGHPHAKPVDVLVRLLESAPEGLVLDPFCGTGSVLLAARMLGRSALGIELDSEYVDRACVNLLIS